MTNAGARFNKIHIRKVYACLAVTCHLHFWQNDRDFLRATVVTRGWNGYRNKSQHRKSTLEKKILPPFQQGFEPATFQSRVRCSNHWAIPAPTLWYPWAAGCTQLTSAWCLGVASWWYGPPRLWGHHGVTEASCLLARRVQRGQGLHQQLRAMHYGAML